MARFVALMALALGLVLVIPTDAQAADLFAVGTQWSGERYSGNGKPLPKWTLKVTKRMGTKFEGEMRIIHSKTKIDTYKVTGTATNAFQGDVVMKNVKSGQFEQTFTGKLKNNEILFDYAGKNETGKSTKGTAVLTLKK